MDLLERKAALDVLTHALRAAHSGDGRLVFVSGEAGIGKSSLVEHFARLQAGGADTIWGYCEALVAPRPLAPFHDIARQIGGRLLVLFKEEMPLQQVLPVLLDELERARPAIVVIEDVHWADEATLDVIRYLGRRIQQLSSLLVVTYRDDELERARLLRRALGALATSRAVFRIELAPLSAAAVRHLVGDASINAAQLHARTGGNPFFVAEVLSGGGSGPIPRAVRDMVFERTAKLDDGAREALQISAVIGRAEPRLLRRLSIRAAEVEACIEVGLLRAAGETPVFRHELTRDAVIETISSQRLVELHAQVLETLLAAGETDSARLAHHAYGADDADTVREHVPTAARQAAAVGAHREAATQYARVLQYVGSDRAVLRAELLAEYARVCGAMDQQGRAIESLGEAVQLWRTLGDRRQEGACLAAQALPMLRSGRNSEADDNGRRAIALLEGLGPSLELAGALRVQGYLRMLDRDKAQALRYGRQAILMARKIDDVATLAAANMTVGTTLLVSDDLGGMTYIDRATKLARASDLHDVLSLTYSNAGTASAEQYHFSEAEQFLDLGIEHALERDFDANRHYMLAWLALVRVYQGRLSEAVRGALQVLEIESLAVISKIMALVALGRARARLGEPGIDEVLDAALELAAPTGTLQRIAPVRLARAEAAWLVGDLEQARAEAEVVWELAVRHAHQWHAGEICFWRACCGAPAPAPAWIARPFALQIEGSWQAAAAAWEALGCPYERARALADGDEDAQKSALRLFDGLTAKPAAEALRQRMRKAGARSVPRGPRAVTRQNAFGFTARQSEIAELVAEGLTNSRISRRLRISAKTVEHHVSAILAKLDVSTRAKVKALIASTDHSSSD